MDKKQRSQLKKIRRDYNSHFLFFSVSIAVILLDQLTKLLISKSMSLSQSIPIINNIFHITYIQNTGAAFGILKNQQLPLIWISIVVAGFILYCYDKIKEKAELIPLSLILGGTIANLIDRVRLNYVVDFLDFRIWPAFNIADSALTIGVIVLIIYFVKKK